MLKASDYYPLKIIFKGCEKTYVSVPDKDFKALDRNDLLDALKKTLNEEETNEYLYDSGPTDATGTLKNNAAILTENRLGRGAFRDINREDILEIGEATIDDEELQEIQRRFTELTLDSNEELKQARESN